MQMAAENTKVMEKDMTRLFLVVTCLSIVYGQQNADFKYEESCHSVGDTLTLEAVYTGSGTPSLVQWSYSGETGANLLITTSNCQLFGSVPPGFPSASRINYMCAATDSLPANTYKLTVTGLQPDELDDSWGATFTPPLGTVPAAEQKAITECITTPEPCCCWCWWGYCYDSIVICIFCWLPLILIALYIVGIIIGIIWKKTNCCCKCFYHCKDSDCCECCQCCGENTYVRCKCCPSWPCGVFCNITQLPFWYQILWGTIIGIPVALGIYTIWKCCRRGNGDVKPKEEKPRHETRSGNTGTGQKKPETKKNESKDSGAHIENEQHNQGKKHREQPLPPSGAGAATGTMHGREDSDGAVSREHVDLQESGRTLKQRPMPDIPRKNERQGHDSKGRGLSANFNDDDHPLIGVNIPTQKAGALEALPEGDGSVKKLKKKKKKSKDQEDEV